MKSNVLKKQVTLWAMLIALVSGGVAVAAGNGVDFSQSPEVSGTTEGQIIMPKEQSRMALDYVNQPPMIPHSVEGYQVTSKVNTCLKCHGVQSYRTTGAPRISPTHFMDSEGHVSSQVAPRRYFCQSCHVPQADAPPIIGNTFEPAPGYGQ
ncbi:nitrate reductase cytochrome c-type subunit [Budvicia aquatica]|uniref:Periplasmic nitrate reductase, electron transfer subunit n=1 Tax=Budvicia aquatica TaxID=82979 RepID=A0A2C6DT37_9GAMM|nr:nitrate reductase cytochrome c-type subunit [Budvicia aquatica]PHI31853.1 nitrate reductase [Budvicia aquatica]GKX51216.1 periplasmic nitrate reductase, electron transfer subunit [Budvicia aquatica]VFS52866.1 Diheme cytochrome c NapB precursor [Budvicia aquatica]